MSAEPLLDFASLLEPIPGDDPSGSSVPYELNEQLEEARKEENPEDYAPDDPTRPTTFKKADWASIVRIAKDTLTRMSKHLLVAARLTEAMVRLQGFVGLRDGLHLMRLLVEQCWDRVQPPIEDGDLEVRAGPFNWLDDPARGARFPSTLRSVPLVTGESGSFSYIDWKQASEGRGPISSEDFEKAVLTASPERTTAQAEAIQECLSELTQLTQSLDAKMGPLAPGMTSVRQALEECASLVNQMKARQGPGSGEAAEAPVAGGPAPAAAPGRPATSRAEAYRQLAQAAALLQELEPHSPIPYLVKRAVDLGALPFPQLIKALIRDANVLSELSRELGIKVEGQGPEAAS